MALEDVMRTIVSTAREQAREMEKKALKERDDILSKARRESESQRKSQLGVAMDEMEARLERERSSQRFSQSKYLLVVRKEMLDQLRGKFRKAVEDMPPKEHEALLDSLLKSAREQMPKGAVSVCARDAPLAKKLLKGMGGYELGEEIDCLGGAVVTAPDGDVSLDLRYDTFLEEVWRDSLLTISQGMFGEGDGAPDEPAEWSDE